jgi:hypothetical protein
VLKRGAAPYLSRRTEHWLKVKCLNRQEFVIGGWMRSEKHGRSLRSLLLGYYEGGKHLRRQGGHRLRPCRRRDLAERLAKIERDTPPLASVPRTYQRGARWGDLRLVAEVTFTSWTARPPPAPPELRGPPRGQASKRRQARTATPGKAELVIDTSPIDYGGHGETERATIRQINLSWAHASAASQFSVASRWSSKAWIAASESLSMLSQSSICPAAKKSSDIQARRATLLDPPM